MDSGTIIALVLIAAVTLWMGRHLTMGGEGDGSKDTDKNT